MKLDTNKLLGFRLTASVTGTVKPSQVMGAKIGGGKDPTCSIVAAVSAK